MGSKHDHEPLTAALEDHDQSKPLARMCQWNENASFANAAPVTMPNMALSTIAMSLKRKLKQWAQCLHLLRIAAWIYEFYRLLRKPHTHGALVAIWNEEQLLLVKTSYRRGYGLPGGGLQHGESARQAAVRELKEELGLAVDSAWLKEPWTITEHKAGGRNTVSIFALPWPQHDYANSKGAMQQPRLRIDDLEIVATAWMSREKALKQHLPGHLRQYLEAQSS